MLGWNANGTLASQNITDNLTGETQNCTYAYDDLARLSSASCGTPWSQSFTYDQYGNITKSGSISWAPGYNAANNRYTLGGVSYDTDGNLLNDAFAVFTWDAYGKISTVTSGSYSGSFTYDALGRMVERNKNGTYTPLLYGPTGFLNAQNNPRYPLPGGGDYLDYSQVFAHKDWLGSVRLTTTKTQTVSTGSAYAPFGESYDVTGTAPYRFAGTDDWDLAGFNDSSDTTGGGGLEDTPNRELRTRQGRWISPDPAGLAAVNMMNPQTWNRYAYVANNPLSSTDPSGLVNDAVNFWNSQLDAANPYIDFSSAAYEEWSNHEALGDNYYNLPGHNNNIQQELERHQSIITTGWDPELGIQRDEYSFTDANGNAISSQKTLAAIAFGQAACNGMATGDVASCILQTYNTMGDSVFPEGGHENFDYSNISILINGENIDTNPADFGCLGGRCGIFNSLDFSHPRTTFHVDMANVYFFPIGTVLHTIADVWGGHSWWRGGVPPFPFQ